MGGITIIRTKKCLLAFLVLFLFPKPFAEAAGSAQEVRCQAPPPIREVVDLRFTELIGRKLFQHVPEDVLRSQWVFLEHKNARFLDSAEIFKSQVDEFLDTEKVAPPHREIIQSIWAETPGTFIPLKLRASDQTFTLLFIPHYFMFMLHPQGTFFIFDGEGLTELPAVVAMMVNKINVDMHQPHIRQQLTGLRNLLQGDIAYVRHLPVRPESRNPDRIAGIHFVSEAQAAVVVDYYAQMFRDYEAMQKDSLQSAANLLRVHLIKKLVLLDDYGLGFYKLLDYELWMLRRALIAQFGKTHPWISEIEKYIKMLYQMAELVLLKKFTHRGWGRLNNRERLTLLTSPFFDSPSAEPWKDPEFTLFRVDYRGWENGFFSSGSEYGKNMRRSRQMATPAVLAEMAQLHSLSLDTREFPRPDTPFVGFSLLPSVPIELYSPEKRGTSEDRLYVLKVPKDFPGVMVNYWSDFKEEMEVLVTHRTKPTWHQASLSTRHFRPPGEFPLLRNDFDPFNDLKDRVRIFQDYRAKLPPDIREKADQEMRKRLFIDPIDFHTAKEHSSRPEWTYGKGAWKGWLEAEALMREAATSGRRIDAAFLFKLHKSTLKYMTSNEYGPLSPAEKKWCRSPYFFKDDFIYFESDTLSPAEVFALQEVDLLKYATHREERGVIIRFPPPTEIPSRLNHIVAELNSHSVLPTHQAARIWRRYVAAGTHWDNNGRVGRLLRDLVLIRAGFVPSLVETPARDLTVPTLRLELEIGHGIRRYMNTYRGIVSTLIQN